MAYHIICFVSFRFVSFRFVSFRFDLFRFVSICFVSFRFVSFRFDLFRFVPFRFCFVSHFTGTRCTQRCSLYHVHNVSLTHGRTHTSTEPQQLTTFPLQCVTQGESMFILYKGTNFNFVAAEDLNASQTYFVFIYKQTCLHILRSRFMAGIHPTKAIYIYLATAYPPTPTWGL